VEVKEMKGKDNSALYGNQYVWKRDGHDHFAHALLYAMVGLSRFGKQAATVIGEHPLTGVPTGYAGKLPAAENQAKVVGSFAPAQFSGDNTVNL